MKREALSVSRLMAWLRSQRAASLAKAAARRRQMIERESKRAVQVREFEGGIYLCLDGVPLVNTDYMCGDMAEAVKEARIVWAKWREKEAEHGRR